MKISPGELREMITERLLKHQEEEWFQEDWLDELTLLFLWVIVKKVWG